MKDFSAHIVADLWSRCYFCSYVSKGYI